MAKKVKKKKRRSSNLIDNMGRKIKYFILNSFFGALIFILGYAFFIKDMDRNLQKFIMIFLWSLFGGLAVSIIIRIIVDYLDATMNLQYAFKHILISFSTAIYIYFGVSRWFSDFDLYSMTSFTDVLGLFVQEEFYEYLLFLTVFKLIMSAFADLYADKLTFGG